MLREQLHCQMPVAGGMTVTTVLAQPSTQYRQPRQVRKLPVNYVN